MVLVPIVAGALLVGGVVVADAATTTSALTACVQRGAPLVAPTASGRCPAGYTLTRVTGARGPAGAAGHDGAAGVSGAAGSPGSPGSPGATGATGLQGPTGPAGAPGSAGTAGDAGDRGAAGATGPEGAPGPQGVPGPQGSTGPTGAPGSDGTNGADGADGADGTGPAWLDTGDPTVYTATDTHTLAGVTLPAGTYVLSASVYVNDAVPFETVATIQCSVIVGGDDLLITPQFPTVASPQVQLIQDVVSFPAAVVSVSGVTSPVSLRCAVADDGGGFTLTGTVLATRVSSATVT